MTLPIQQWTAQELIAGVLGSRIRVQEIADALLTQIDATSCFNAFIALDREQIRAQARSLDASLAAGRHLPLHGLPLIVKDNIDTADLPTTCGTPSLAGHRPHRNAAALQLLLDSGALLMGKANLHELAAGVTSDNPYFGAARNPYDPRMSAGGSSGGTAAAIAARQVPVGLATDTGGSARIPASLCGVCGFRPSTGQYSADGLLVLSPTRDTLGLMARDVADLELLHRVLTGRCATGIIVPTGLRIGVPRRPHFSNLDDPVAVAVERALELLAASGFRLIEQDLTQIVDLHAACGDEIVAAEVRGGLEVYLRRSGIEPAAVIRAVATVDVRKRLAALLERDPPDPQRYRYLLAIARPALQRAYADYFLANRVDVLCYPTTPLTAREIPDVAEVARGEDRTATFRAYSQNTDPGANAGLPSLSIPVGLSPAGLPIGLAIEGPRGSDDRLLQIGRLMNEILPRLPAPN